MSLISSEKILINFIMVAWGGFIPSILIEKRFEPSISSDNRVQTLSYISGSASQRPIQAGLPGHKIANIFMNFVFMMYF